MSEFIDHIEARLYEPILQRSRPMKLQPVIVDLKVSPRDMTFTTQRQYSIEVGWRRDVWAEPGSVQRVIDAAKRELTDTIFGEFRQLLFKLERECYEGDYEACQETIAKILKEVHL